MRLPYVFHRTDDPVRDAEVYLQTLDQRPVMCKCDLCGGEIHNEDDYYEADDAYLFEDGCMVCAGCLDEYCRSKKI